MTMLMAAELACEVQLVSEETGPGIRTYCRLKSCLVEESRTV